MKNRKKLFILPTLIIIFLLYLSDRMTVSASVQSNTGPVTEPEKRLPGESAVEPETELPGESTVEPEAEPPEESAVEPETGLPEEAAAEPDTGQSLEADAEPFAEPAEESDFVSTGTELEAWLKSHKETGGLVELTGDIVLDESCAFVWTGSSPAEHIVVETAGHTITVSGRAEFWSNAYLTFRGLEDEYGIFHVMEGGMLSLSGVIVESGQYGERPSESAAQYALWQEEGSGLVIRDCRIAGNVHYANTPFVMYKNSTYAVVEEGQTAEDALPSEMRCSVNYQGQVSNNKPVQVTWHLSGTEEQQEKRLRFLVQGSFSHAASEMPPVCAVVYNDYPLTFTKVETHAGSGSYIFQGGYTLPGNLLPMTLTSEYSFDGVNWIVYDEAAVPDDAGTFLIGIQSEQWDTEAHPYLYIRLQGEYNGAHFFSNVLRYTAGNLEAVEDCGGDRGTAPKAGGSGGAGAGTEAEDVDSNGAAADTGSENDSSAAADTGAENDSSAAAGAGAKIGNRSAVDAEAESGSNTAAGTGAESGKRAAVDAGVGDGNGDSAGKDARLGSRQGQTRPKPKNQRTQRR